MVEAFKMSRPELSNGVNELVSVPVKPLSTKSETRQFDEDFPEVAKNRGRAFIFEKIE